MQPSYIPWRGTFDLIHRADLFVFYDDVQYDRRGWRNRNRVKTPQGSRWLTIPVSARGAQTTGLPINRVATAAGPWPAHHLETLRRLYGRAPHFDAYRAWLERVYADPPRLLADFTIALTKDIAAFLGITKTRFMRSSELAAVGSKTERLLDVLRKVGASRYLSGPTARAYLDEGLLADAGIAVEWMQYDYPDYPQLYPPFDPHVSVLDLLFMTGERAAEYIFPRGQEM